MYVCMYVYIYIYIYTCIIYIYIYMYIYLPRLEAPPLHSVDAEPLPAALVERPLRGHEGEGDAEALGPEAVQVLGDLGLRLLLRLRGDGAVQRREEEAGVLRLELEGQPALVVCGARYALRSDEAVDVLGDLQRREVLEVHRVERQALEEVLDLHVHRREAEDALLDHELEDRVHGLVARLAARELPNNKNCDHSNDINNTNSNNSSNSKYHYQR